MHKTSMESMKHFIYEYLKGGERVLDVGSMDINGSYQPLFKDYTGLDIAEGNNVDIVAENPYEWWQIDDEVFDVVISGQAFEHIEFPEKTMAEIGRVLKPGGYCCIIAPSAGPSHGYPNDYHRFTEKSMCDLADVAGIEVVETKRNPESVWKDVVLIARKPAKAKDKKKK